MTKKTELGIFRKVDLSDAYEGWDGAYICFKPMRATHFGLIKRVTKLTEAQDLDDDTVKAVQDLEDLFVSLFVKGKVYDVDMNLIDAEPDHVRDLMLSNIQKFMRAMTGNSQDPKASMESEPSSSTTETPATTQTNTPD